MLDKLKRYAHYSIVLVLGIVFAGSGIYVMWLEARRSAAFKYLNDVTVESWNAMALSPHRQATVWEMAVMVGILILSTAVLISPVLALWVFAIRALGIRNPDGLAESRSAQVERDGEDNHGQVCDDVVEEIGIRINKNTPLRRSPVYSVKERRRSGMYSIN